MEPSPSNSKTPPGDQTADPAATGPGPRARPAVAPADAAATCDFPAEEAATQLVRILDQYLADLKAHQAPSRAELLARHPEFAAQLEVCLAGLEFIHGAESASPDHPSRLGDFRIVREIGRGGMGAVFEAEQLSLGRRVALKILRFGGVSDPQAVERFQREAETVARLHHTNIVPIFAVGNERGVNYYAMQLIEGESLADVLTKSQGPLPSDQVADWGLQAADALAHAHQRGVVHRDVKPSNLLVDNERRIWLTDFGLARRFDDVTLSMTGAILGTPRYMSPEQASAAHKRVDQRSDVFSLGATLYELATGRPAFTGETTHAVIQNILVSEPPAIRSIAPSVPRDLETVIMKCLAKEPTERYHSAAELADDLRAVRDGRPIRARRAGWTERAARWLRTQQRSVRLAAAAVVSTLLLVGASIASWWAYDAWRQSSLTLLARTPPLVAEIRDARGAEVRSETVPMQHAINMAAGEYTVRVSAEGQLSETFDIQLRRGAANAPTLDLTDRLLWKPWSIERSFRVTQFGRQSALVLLENQGLRLRTTGGPDFQWSSTISAERCPNPEQARGLRWAWSSLGSSYSGLPEYDVRPWVAPRSVDVNADGVDDLLIAGRHQAWLMAVSGQDGRMLWFAPRGSDVAAKPNEQAPNIPFVVLSAVVGEPDCRFDYDGDGLPDIIATIADMQLVDGRFTGQDPTKFWVEATSARTGERLWQFELPPAWFEVPTGVEVPYQLRWFAGYGSGAMSGGASSMTMRRHITRRGGEKSRLGTHAYLPASVRLLDLPNARQIAIVAGTTCATLNPKDGTLVSQPIDMGARPGRPANWHDVNGDGIPELILLEEVPPPAPNTPSTARLVVWSLTDRRLLWSRGLTAQWPHATQWHVADATWPWIADLDGDGRGEIVVPDGSSELQPGKSRFISSDSTPWGALSVLEGRTGTERWRKRLVSSDEQIDHCLLGPDRNGDGVRDVYAITVSGRPSQINVDVLSGRDGEPLGWARQATPPTNNSSLEYHLNEPRWWASGEDGWPQLLVPVVSNNPGQHPPLLYAFSSGSDRLTHTGSRISAAVPADIDGDGVEDLLLFESQNDTSLDTGGQLQCLRGVAGEPWRRVGEPGQPVADLDGDGIGDLVVRIGDTQLKAQSGATGRALWTSPRLTAHQTIQFQGAVTTAPQRGLSFPTTGSADLNGDGSNDLLAWHNVAQFGQATDCLMALSGQTGRPLWRVSELKLHELQAVLAATAHDLDGDGKLEVVWCLAVQSKSLAQSVGNLHHSELRVVVTSGQTGQVRWNAVVSPTDSAKVRNIVVGSGNDVRLPPVVVDVDGDGMRDIVAPAVADNGDSLDTIVLNGRDGAPLWRRPMPTDAGQHQLITSWVPPATVDVDGDGRVELAFLESKSITTPDSGTRRTYVVTLVSGRNGEEVWSWASDVPLDYSHPGIGTQRAEILQPRVLRAGNHRQRIAVALLSHRSVLTILEPNGTARTIPVNRDSLAAGFWAVDVDNDGVDELVMRDDSAIALRDVDRFDQPRWRVDLGLSGLPRLAEILPARGEQAAILPVFRYATDNSVLGLELTTGRIAWSCAGVIPREPSSNVYMMPTFVTLLDAGAAGPPHVYYAEGANSRVRIAYAPPAGEAPPFTFAAYRAPERPYVAHSDDRWQRDLPWVERQVPLDEIARYIGWSLLLATLLFVLPAGYLLGLVRQRRFSLRAFLWLPLIAGLALTAALLPLPVELSRGRSERYWAAAAFVPVVVAVYMLVVWFVRGQFRRASLWLACTVLLSTVMAAIALGTALRTEPLQAEESYDLAYWYLIWFVGAYLTSWILTLATPVELAVRRLWCGKRAHGV